jgi:two-component system, cell cycle response regulator DivK
VPLVLIVDDNEKNRKLATNVLRAAGFETLQAATGAEAITLAMEHVPDVVLMDLQLPDMNGTDALRELDRNEPTAQIPVVALSAMPLEGTGRWLEELGFAGSIEKPIRIATFPDEVRGYCAEG